MVWDDWVKSECHSSDTRKKQVENEKNWCNRFGEGPDPILNHEKMSEDKKEKAKKMSCSDCGIWPELRNVKVPTVGVVTHDSKGSRKQVGF